MKIRILDTKILIIILIVSTLAMSCRTKKTVITKNNKRLSTKSVIDSCNFNNLKFDTFSAKYRAKFVKNDKTQAFVGNIRIHKDSIIWISVSPGMGIEVARVLLSKDSVFFIDRFHKKYHKGDYQFIKKKLGVALDFATLHAILTNKIFEYPTNSDVSFYKDYNIELVNNLIVFDLNHKMKKTSNTHSRYSISTDYYKPVEMNIAEPTKARGINLLYSDFDENSANNLPTKINFNYFDTSSKFVFDINFIKYIFNKKINTRFAIPNGYSKIKFN